VASRNIGSARLLGCAVLVTNKWRRRKGCRSGYGPERIPGRADTFGGACPRKAVGMAPGALRSRNMRAKCAPVATGEAKVPDDYGVSRREKKRSLWKGRPYAADAWVMGEGRYAREASRRAGHPHSDTCVASREQVAHMFGLRPKAALVISCVYGRKGDVRPSP